MPSPTALRGVRELLTRASAAAARRLNMGRLRQISYDKSLPQATRLEARDLRNGLLKDIAAGNIGLVGLAHQAQIELAGLAERVKTLEGELQQARTDLSGRLTSEAAAALQEQVEDLTIELATVKSALERAADNLQIAQQINRDNAAAHQAEIDSLNNELSQAKLALRQASQQQQPAPAPTEKVELINQLVNSYGNGHAALITDVGSVRKTNQDSAGYAELADGRKVYVVADGMGGHGGGEIASRIAVQEFISAVEAGQSPLEALLTTSRRVISLAMEEVRVALLKETFGQANLSRNFIRGLLSLARRNDWSLLYIIENFAELAQAHGLDLAQLQVFVRALVISAEQKKLVGNSGFGTTLVAAIVDETRQTVQLVQVGDSRIKAVTPSQARVLTLDHSLKIAAYSAQQGSINLPLSETEIAKIDLFPFDASNIILSCLGGQSLPVRGRAGGQGQPGLLLDQFEYKPPSHVRVLEIPWQRSAEQTKLLLYSDGAIDGLAESALTRAARSSDVPLEVVTEITSQALAVSRDNITVALAMIPGALDLSNIVELRTKMAGQSAQREILERVVNGQLAAELNITPGGIVETAVQPEVTAGLAPTYDEVAALPLRNQLRYLSDQSADRDIARRLTNESLLPLCLTEKGYGRITASLTDPDAAVARAAQAVIHLWVLEKLKELSSPAIETNYYNQMIAFLAQNHLAELRVIINQAGSEAALRNMAVQIWQSVQLRPAAPVPGPKQLNKALPLEDQLREIAQAKDSEAAFRDEVIDFLIDNKQVPAVQRHLRGKDPALRAGAELFLTRYLRRALAHWLEENKGASDAGRYRGLRRAVKAYQAARLIERIALDPEEKADLKQLAGRLYQDLKPGRIASWFGNIFS